MIHRRHFLFHTVVFGAWLLTRPRNTTVVYVNTAPYYYTDGVYYVKKSESCYVTVPPPVGAVLETLPQGAVQVYHGGHTYYYGNGTWYLPGNSYTVVQAPVGATATFLPKNAQKQTIDGQTYFVYGSAYYLARFVDGLTLYQVVAQPQPKQQTANLVDALPEDKINVKVGGATYYFVDGDWYADADGGYAKARPPVGASVPYLPEDTVQKDGLLFAKGVYYQTYTKDGIELYKVAKP